MQSIDIANIYSLDPPNVDKLKKAGIYTIREMLERGATPKGRKEISTQTDIKTKLIFDWVLQAELLTIEGIGQAYLQLLILSGIDSAPKLTFMRAAELYKKLQETNLKKAVVQRLPSLRDVRRWIRLAENSPYQIM